MLLAVTPVVEDLSLIAASMLVKVVLAAAVLLFTEAEKPPTCTPLMVMKPAATVVAMLAALLQVVADKAVEPPTSELPKLKAVTPVSPVEVLMRLTRLRLLFL